MNCIFALMKFTLISRNKSISAESNGEFVRWMRKSDVQNFRKNADFMEAYSIRKSTFENITLRFDHEDHFVEDLVNNQLLKIEEERKWTLFPRQNR